MRKLTLIIVAAAACAGAPVTAKDDGSALGTDSESARAILRGHCGTCHRGDLPAEAKPAALKVFDLSKTDWHAAMTREQLRKSIGRLSASDEEEQLYEAWVATELARREALQSTR